MPNLVGMRLRDEERIAIREAAARFFQAEVRLFGSRVDDAARGGDIDLFIESDLAVSDVAARRIAMLAHLERQLGERKVDLVVADGRSDLAIHRVARAHGVLL